MPNFSLGKVEEGRFSLPSSAMSRHRVLHESVSLEDRNVENVLDVHLAVVVALLGDLGDFGAWS